MRPTPCGCTSARLSGFTGTAVECGKAATVASQTHFFCLARKSGQKEALENDLWRLRADAFQRPVRAQDRYFSNSLWFRQIYHTQLRIVNSRFCFCSFWEYSTNCAHLLCFVGADDSVRPVKK